MADAKIYKVSLQRKLKEGFDSDKVFTVATIILMTSLKNWSINLKHAGGVLIVNMDLSKQPILLMFHTCQEVQLIF